MYLFLPKIGKGIVKWRTETVLILKGWIFTFPRKNTASIWTKSKIWWALSSPPEREGIECFESIRSMLHQGFWRKFRVELLQVNFNISHFYRHWLQKLRDRLSCAAIKLFYCDIHWFLKNIIDFDLLILSSICLWPVHVSNDISYDCMDCVLEYTVLFFCTVYHVMTFRQALTWCLLDRRSYLSLVVRMKLPPPWVRWIWNAT